MARPAASLSFDIPFRAMGSACSVCVVAQDLPRARALAQHAIDEVARIETKYSRYRADSALSRINAAAGADWVAVDAETEALLDYAALQVQASGGLFDPTSGILRRVWDFKTPRVPTADELAPVLALIGWDGVEREPGRVRLARAGMELDFGGFGKEYAADRAATALRAAGASEGYVNLGGDFHVFGPRPDGAPWTIAIQHPRNPRGTVASIQVRQGGLTTSGDYERYFELDGRRYCHILNPRTGMPVQGLQGVSVLAPSALAAGSLCTLAMLHEAQGQALLDTLGVPYLLVDAAGQLHRSDGTARSAN